MSIVASVLAGDLAGTGTGSEVMDRIAAPMDGGMISAVMLALLVIPVAY
ncbi:hypothetical protein [Marinobacter sp.]|nr:hypothetical protein [Marinobacter sp.]HKK55211.1 hypothetical protein [Marinobacter sp.]